MLLKSGYARAKQAEAEYRAMTIEEAKALNGWGTIPFLDNAGKVRECRLNGAVKTWKRDPSRIEVPVKYGLYECVRLTGKSDGTMERLLVRVEEEK